MLIGLSIDIHDQHCQKLFKLIISIILRYDNFGENQTPLQRNGMAAIPKILCK